MPQSAPLDPIFNHAGILPSAFPKDLTFESFTRLEGLLILNNAIYLHLDGCLGVLADTVVTDLLNEYKISVELEGTSARLQRSLGLTGRAFWPRPFQVQRISALLFRHFSLRPHKEQEAT